MKQLNVTIDMMKELSGKTVIGDRDTFTEVFLTFSDGTVLGIKDLALNPYHNIGYMRDHTDVNELEIHWSVCFNELREDVDYLVTIIIYFGKYRYYQSSYVKSLTEFNVNDLCRFNLYASKEEAFNTQGRN